MRPQVIPPERVNKDNSNLRKYSDHLWRELRKLRFRKARPHPYTNEMAAEQLRHKYEDSDPCFDHDVEVFIKTRLTEREGGMFRLFVYGGLTQMEIAASLGVCQATVANELDTVLAIFKEYYYGG